MNDRVCKCLRYQWCRRVRQMGGERCYDARTKCAKLVMSPCRMRLLHDPKLFGSTFQPERVYLCDGDKRNTHVFVRFAAEETWSERMHVSHSSPLYLGIRNPHLGCHKSTICPPQNLLFVFFIVFFLITIQSFSALLNCIFDFIYWRCAHECVRRIRGPKTETRSHYDCSRCKTDLNW